MYIEYFGLKEYPFSIAPDPRYFYMSEKHREALAHLIYGIRKDGFIVLTGEVGTGKTTVCRCLLQQLPENTDIAFVYYPRLTVRELFATICDELRIEYPRSNGSSKDLLDCINAYLLDAHARGRKTVLIIEEAQKLGAELLEQVRLLTNLETDSRKLLQIIMVGQPELRDVLGRPDMKQVAQRITARYHLGPLSKEEVSAYVSHRLAVAGGQPELFSRSAIDKLFRLSGGIPRVINLLCDRSLLGAYSQGKRTVNSSIVSRASQEVAGKLKRRHPRKGLRLAVAILVFAICGAVLAGVYYDRTARSDVSKSQVSSGKVRADAGKRQGPVSKVNKDFNKSQVSPKETHVEESTLEWPAAQPIAKSEDMAYRTLFERWNATYGGGGEAACNGVSSSGLRCLRGLGNLNILIRLNRPAVLTLFDSRGRKYYTTLMLIHGNEATLRLGSETVKTDIHRIQKWWFGDFTLLWRTPPDYRGDIKPGAVGLPVKWLNKKLSRIAPGVDTGSGLVYNNEMLKQVKKFQLANGLTPDGIVGPRTMILLNSEDGIEAATLAGGQEGK